MQRWRKIKIRLLIEKVNIFYFKELLSKLLHKMTQSCHALFKRESYLSLGNIGINQNTINIPISVFLRLWGIYIIVIIIIIILARTSNKHAKGKVVYKTSHAQTHLKTNRVKKKGKKRKGRKKGKKKGKKEKGKIYKWKIGWNFLKDEISSNGFLWWKKLSQQFTPTPL